MNRAAPLADLSHLYEVEAFHATDSREADRLSLASADLAARAAEATCTRERHEAAALADLRWLGVQNLIGDQTDGLACGTCPRCNTTIARPLQPMLFDEVSF